MHLFSQRNPQIGYPENFLEALVYPTQKEFPNDLKFFILCVVLETQTNFKIVLIRGKVKSFCRRPHKIPNTGRIGVLLKTELDYERMGKNVIFLQSLKVSLGVTLKVRPKNCLTSFWHSQGSYQGLS